MVIQSLDERSTKKEIQDMIVDVEPNRNRVIAGFLNIMSRKMKDNATEELREDFKVFDRDQDGYISSIELRNVMVNLGERLTYKEAEQMVREAVLDGDDLVSYEEFVRIMMMLSSVTKRSVKETKRQLPSARVTLRLVPLITTIRDQPGQNVQYNTGKVLTPEQPSDC